MPEYEGERREERQGKAPGEQDGREWVSAHVFYAGPLDGLLTGLVRPLLGELATERLVHRYFFQRYWDRGPHLRLRLLPTAAGRPEDVRRLVRDRCRRFFAAAPAPETVGDKRQWPSRMEWVTGTARSPYPNNFLAFVPYRPEHHRYGYGRPLAAVEDHFALCSRTTLRLISAGLPAGQRDVAAFSLILMSWFTAEPDLWRLSQLPVLRAAADRRHDTEHYPPLPHRQLLRSLAARVREAAAGVTDLRPPGGDAFADWAESLLQLRRSLDASQVLPVFNACAHLACNRLGTGLGGERMLRHLAGRAVTELAAAEEGR